MREYERILVLQTAFLGDVILTLPLVQVLKKEFPSAKIDMLVTKRASSLLENHPALYKSISYDKHGNESGLLDFFKKVKEIKNQNYQITFVPHRSLRSATLVALAKIPERIGFHNSAGRYLFSKTIHYDKTLHEIERNLRLLNYIGIYFTGKELPKLYPSEFDIKIVDKFFKEINFNGSFNKLVAIAPGTVWHTKRWLTERFIELARNLIHSDCHIVLIGGEEDVCLCDKIKNTLQHSYLISAAGKMTLLQSAELIRRCKVLVCNDSAPMHIACAMKTPVVAIFGATVPSFGFAPYGENDQIVEIQSLDCRPCSIHGGNTCPIKSFDCMEKISVKMVFEKVMTLVNLGTKDNIS